MNVALIQIEVSDFLRLVVQLVYKTENLLALALTFIILTLLFSSCILQLMIKFPNLISGFGWTYFIFHSSTVKFLHFYIKVKILCLSYYHSVTKFIGLEFRYHSSIW